MKPREYAWGVLYRIVYEHGYASLILRSRKESFSPADTALISELVYGTLRNYSYLEYQWSDLAKKAKHKTAVLLDMSIYQLLYLDRIPDYAVINEAVEMAPRSEKGFVNAILHKVKARGRRKVDKSDPLEALALETSHPLWLIKMWNAHYGFDKTRAIALEDQKPAVVYGRCNTLKMKHADLAKDPRVHFLEGECFTYDGVLSATDWFEKGMVLIQDRSSQSAAALLDAKSGMLVKDCCSAPGTKAQETACAMDNQGVIEAGDIDPKRVGLIDALMKRTGVNIVHAQVHDATMKVEAECEKYDRILIDAPCSGLGDLRHKPEIRLHLKPEDIDALVQTQKKILDANADALKKGGLLVYSTCTLNKKENEQQIRSFLKEHEEYLLKQEHTWFPDEMQSDGFYGAVLQKKE